MVVYRAKNAAEGVDADVGVKDEGGDDDAEGDPPGVTGWVMLFVDSKAAGMAARMVRELKREMW
jgi:hypothetical protein